MLQTNIVYDSIGKTYDVTRKPDPRLVSEIVRLLDMKESAEILDIGCGTGNYTIALQKQGFNLVGLDISREMLDKAATKNQDIQWVLGDARTLADINRTFDACICILATHHIQSLSTLCSSVFRVLKPGGIFLIFTATPTQMKFYWLNHYFPTIIPLTVKCLVEYTELENLLIAQSFERIESSPFFIDKYFQDLFLHAGKYRPEIYLDPLVRAGISTFALNTNDHELKQGLTKLTQDIQNGNINTIISNYENNLGDYLFVRASKKARQFE